MSSASRLRLLQAMRDAVATVRWDSSRLAAISGLDRSSTTSMATFASVGVRLTPAATYLPGGRLLAHSDHEWHRHDSELLRANPDHDATMAVPCLFRNPAVAPAQASMWRRPTADSASLCAIDDSALLITALSADAAGIRRSRGSPIVTPLPLRPVAACECFVTLVSVRLHL